MTVVYSECYKIDTIQQKSCTSLHCNPEHNVTFKFDFLGIINCIRETITKTTAILPQNQQNTSHWICIKPQNKSSCLLIFTRQLTIDPSSLVLFIMSGRNSSESQEELFPSKYLLLEIFHWRCFGLNLGVSASQAYSLLQSFGALGTLEHYTLSSRV